MAGLWSEAAGMVNLWGAAIIRTADTAGGWQDNHRKEFRLRKEKVEKVCDESVFPCLYIVKGLYKNSRIDEPAGEV